MTKHCDNCSAMEQYTQARADEVVQWKRAMIDDKKATLLKIVDTDGEVIASYLLPGGEVEVICEDPRARFHTVDEKVWQGRFTITSTTGVKES